VCWQLKLEQGAILVTILTIVIIAIISIIAAACYSATRACSLLV